MKLFSVPAIRTKSFAAILAILLAAANLAPIAGGYTVTTTAPQPSGCPQPNHWNLSLSSPLGRRWSTSLPLAPPTMVTVAAAQSSAQLDEIEQTISAAFGVWSGVAGTTFNAASYPGLLAPIERVSAADSCSNDAQSNVDGLNTICFDQSSMGFTTGVLAFTRIITANAPGVSVGASATSTFAGQILDADTLFRPDGQASFATPAALATSRGQGAYDLESLLAHELGHWLGLGHSAVWSALMFPYSPSPGQFAGARPTALQPDAPLADDDRTGIRTLYPDPADTVNVGAISGRVVPANPFSLATQPAPSPGSSVTGIFGAHVVAVNADTGAVVAGAIQGWSCSASSPPAQFDGSFDIERLPIGENYVIYAEPLVNLAAPSDFDSTLGSCPSGSAPACAAPAANTNFNPSLLPPH